MELQCEKEGILKTFSELSKSSKIFNAYGYLLTAEDFSKRKNNMFFKFLIKPHGFFNCYYKIENHLLIN